MTVWRITHARHREDLPRGLGGLHAAGRWHEKGVPIIYASDHPSTALLEMLINASAAKLRAENYVVVPLELRQDDVHVIAENDLPSDWRQHPHSHSTRSIGMRWLSDARWLALSVPSAVFPLAQNILLNPRHSLMKEVRIGAAQLLLIDERLAVPPTGRESASSGPAD